MRTPNINYAWTNLMVEELLRCGVVRFVISPGSRNSPLVIAAAGHGKTETIVHPDERAAAFYALGCARSSGRPVALIATSGTAVANHFPAVIEASHSTVPMILLTSDRPVELRDTGAPQTMDQVRLYGGYVRWSIDLPAPTREVPPEFVLTTIDQAVYRATRSPAGPVQLNCMFREPLAPVEEEDATGPYLKTVAEWRQGKTPFTTYAGSAPVVPGETIDEVGQRIAGSSRGVMVVGQLPVFVEKGNIVEASNRLGLPLLADVTSGLRFGPGDSRNLVTCFDYVLSSDRFSETHRPDMIVHLGAPPTSKRLNQYLQESGAEYVHVAQSPFRIDPGHRVTTRLEMAPDRFCRALVEGGFEGESALLPVFSDAEAAAATALAGTVDGADEISELAVARTVERLIPPDSNLFLASSMPVRDADSAGVLRDDDIHVCANRGVNGIDGTVAAAVGFAAGNGCPTTLLIGDLALFHDLNSLLLVRRSPVPVTIVVINNDGGGIFSFLPIAEYPEHFETCFGTPHGMTFEKAAAQFGLAYSTPGTMAEFEAAYRTAVESKEIHLIEVRTERQANVGDHREVWEKVGRAVEDALLATAD